MSCGRKNASAINVTPLPGRVFRWKRHSPLWTNTATRIFEHDVSVDNGWSITRKSLVPVLQTVTSSAVTAMNCTLRNIPLPLQ